MDGQKEQREWHIREQLPAAFIQLINEAVRDRPPGKSFMQISIDWQVDPALVSRWMAGFGPLDQEHIQKLAMQFGPGVYTALALFQTNQPENQKD